MDKQQQQQEAQVVELDVEQVEAVSGGRWVVISESTTAACTGDGSRCGSQTVTERVWID